MTDDHFSVLRGRVDDLHREHTQLRADQGEMRQSIEVTSVRVATLDDRLTAWMDERTRQMQAEADAKKIADKKHAEEEGARKQMQKILTIAGRVVIVMLPLIFASFVTAATVFVLTKYRVEQGELNDMRQDEIISGLVPAVERNTERYSQISKRVDRVETRQDGGQQK